MEFIKKLPTFAFAITKKIAFGSLAQLNRASDYGSEGCGFESRGSHFKVKELQYIVALFLCVHTNCTQLSNSFFVFPHFNTALLLSESGRKDIVLKSKGLDLGT